MPCIPTGWPWMLPIVSLLLLFSPSFKNTQVQLCPASPAALPDHGIEGLAGDESATVIERHCLGVLPRDRKRKGLEAVTAERPRAFSQKPRPEATAPIPAAHANLGHVAHVFA